MELVYLFSGFGGAVWVNPDTVVQLSFQSDDTCKVYFTNGTHLDVPGKEADVFLREFEHMPPAEEEGVL